MHGYIARGPIHDLLPDSFRGFLIAPSTFFDESKNLKGVKNLTLTLGWTDYWAVQETTRYYGNDVIDEMIEGVRNNYRLINALNRSITFKIRAMYALDEVSIRNLERLCEVLEPLIGEFSFTIAAYPVDEPFLNVEKLMNLLSQLCAKRVIFELPQPLVDGIKERIEMLGSTYGAFGSAEEQCPARNAASFATHNNIHIIFVVLAGSCSLFLVCKNLVSTNVFAVMVAVI